jgi:hypothetical protein
MKSILLLMLLPCLVEFMALYVRAEEEARVTLSLDEFEDLFSSARLKDAERQLQDERQHQEKEYKIKLEHLKQQHMLPENFHILSHTATGSFNASSSDDVAEFDVKMTVRTMAPQWTTVPLVSNATVTSDWWIEMEQEDGSFTSVDPITSPDILLLRRSELATNRAGLFCINFRAYSRVVKKRNIHELVMSQFLHPLSDMSLRVHGDAVRDFSVEPVDAVWDVVQDPNSTNIRVTLPLTADSIGIRWLDGNDSTKSKTQDDRDEQQEDVPQVTSIHEVMHSVGEGMVRSSHILEFTSSSELSEPAQFSLYGDLRIISIVGHALQSWEIVSRSKDEQLVRVYWKRSHLDSTATLLISTESDRSDSQQGKIELPRIECRNVLRQVGHIGVAKDANIEVHEHSIRGSITRCEPPELSSKLRLNMDRPIVLSYKYLNPLNATVVLDVQEHVAMETLEATVDRLHYKAVVTDTHTVHSFMVVLQSTKLQYLELFGLPESASMFTLLVNSVPAKPVKGKHKSILLPLLVGLNPEAANEGSTLLTSVELSYISAHPEPMGRNGTLSLAPPLVNLPISVLTTHLRLPKRYKYKFTGDFLEPDHDLAFPIPSTYFYQTGKRVVAKDYKFSFKDDVWPDDDDTPKEAAVKIVTPNTGRSYYFHRLLVVDTKLVLNVSFEPVVKQQQVSWWSSLYGLLKIGSCYSA